MGRLPTFSFDFDIKRSKRKTLAIIVKSGKVEVKSPLFIKKVDIYNFVAEKKSWIEKHLSLIHI